MRIDFEQSQVMGETVGMREFFRVGCVDERNFLRVPSSLDEHISLYAGQAGVQAWATQTRPESMKNGRMCGKRL